MSFNIRVLEFWVMKTTNIYVFFHLLNLIKIKPHMDFGKKLAFAHICHKTHSFSLFLFQGEWRKAHVNRPNKQVKDTPWLPFICLFHLIKVPN
jgi:hypothetical protein